MKVKRHEGFPVFDDSAESQSSAAIEYSDSNDVEQASKNFDDHDNGNYAKEFARSSTRLDSIDLRLIDHLMSGKSSRESARILNRPVSTIQRRARLLIQHGILKPTFELGYSKLGMKKGFLHVYLADGNISEIFKKLLTREGIFSVGVHLGNSDVIGEFVFRDSREVLELIAWSKHQEGVERVVWSEEVYSESTSPKIEKIIKVDKQGKTTI